MSLIPGSAFPPPADRRRLLVTALSRGLGIAVLLTTAFFTLPLDRLAGLPFWTIIAGGLVVLIGVITFEVSAILQSAHPGVKAVEAICLTGPLFLLLFASTYYLMATSDGASFSASGLSRVDSLYFTMATFTTVGFGDIVATTEAARLLVTVQMVLDLVLIGAVLKVFVGAVRLGRSGSAPSPESAP